MVAFIRWAPFCEDNKHWEKWSKVNIQPTTQGAWLRLGLPSPSPTLFNGAIKNICYLLDLMKSECIWDLYHLEWKLKELLQGSTLFLINWQCSRVASPLAVASARRWLWTSDNGQVMETYLWEITLNHWYFGGGVIVSLCEIYLSLLKVAPVWVSWPKSCGLWRIPPTCVMIIIFTE